MHVVRPWVRQVSRITFVECKQRGYTGSLCAPVRQPRCDRSTALFLPVTFPLENIRQCDEMKATRSRRMVSRVRPNGALLTNKALPCREAIMRSKRCPLSGGGYQQQCRFCSVQDGLLFVILRSFTSLSAVATREVPELNIPTRMDCCPTLTIGWPKLDRRFHQSSLTTRSMPFPFGMNRRFGGDDHSSVVSKGPQCLGHPDVGQSCSCQFPTPCKP